MFRVWGLSLGYVVALLKRLLMRTYEPPSRSPNEELPLRPRSQKHLLVLSSELGNADPATGYAGGYLVPKPETRNPKP